MAKFDVHSKCFKTKRIYDMKQKHPQLVLGIMPGR
jgi:hypothetical protein